MILAVLLGATGWTLAEYCIHRWAGHDRRLTGNPFGVEHITHHSKGNYFSPTYKKIVTATVVGGMMLGPAALVAGWAHGAAFVIGFVISYLLYELFHRWEHVHPGLNAYGRWARRHHFYHHFHDPKVNHGVTTPVWDIVFGTYRQPDVIRVPRRLAMPWLVDPDTQDVREGLGDWYQLR